MEGTKEKMCTNKCSQSESQKEEETAVAKHYNELIKFIEGELDNGNRLRKGVVETLKGHITKWAFAQAEIIGENKRLREEVDSLKKDTQAKNSTTVAPEMSYAATTKVKLDKRATTINKLTNTSKATLFITSKSGEDIKKVQETFQNAIDPVKAKLKIKAMRTTKKVLIIETENDTEAKKISENPAIKEKLNANLQKRGNP